MICFKLGLHSYSCTVASCNCYLCLSYKVEEKGQHHGKENLPCASAYQNCSSLMGRTEWTGRNGQEEPNCELHGGQHGSEEGAWCHEFKVTRAIIWCKCTRLGQISRPVDCSHRPYCQPRTPDLSKHEHLLHNDMALKKVVLANCTASAIPWGLSATCSCDSITDNWPLQGICS